MKKKPVTPKDASATILLNHDLTQVLWARRNPKLKFLGGFHGFVGGKFDKSDELTDVRNCEKPAMARAIACAAREMFEEVGVLLVRNGHKLTTGQRVSLHDDLISGRNTFTEILKFWGLWIDAEDFTYTGFWTTPEFSTIRFKTHFFIAVCPEKQKPYQAITEMQEIEFINAKKAVNMWEKSKVLIVPPVLFPLQELAKNTNIQTASANLLEKSTDSGGNIDYIGLNPRIICFPLQTKTLPPATHTNCFIVGKKEFIIIDAATPFVQEQEKLIKLVDEFIEKGYQCKEIVVSHLHPDHFGGETVLKKHLKDRFGFDVPISAHEITAKNLDGKVYVEKFLEDNQVYALQDEDGKEFELKTLHTPGHARGHLCFYDEEFGFLLSSDNVVGLGTVVIAPPEGDMSDYLHSLNRMKSLTNLSSLCGSHGSAVYDARGKIEEYIEHRRDREGQILRVVRQGVNEPSKIVEIVYEGLSPTLIPLAEKSVEAHLDKLAKDGKISLST